jgi:hypothetical protein
LIFLRGVLSLSPLPLILQSDAWICVQPCTTFISIELWKDFEKFQTVNELDANEFSIFLPFVVHLYFVNLSIEIGFLLATSTSLQIKTWKFVSALKMFSYIYCSIFVKKFPSLNELGVDQIISLSLIFSASVEN